MFRAVVGAFGLLIGWLYMSAAQAGLWEDGYFVVRFARNFWHHGTFAWNVSDGPLYGMTSQTLQAVGTLLYAIAPHHMVLGLKATLCLGLLLSLVVLGQLGRKHAGSVSGLLPALLGLSTSLILRASLTGLETTLALLVLLSTLHVVLDFERGAKSPWMVAALSLLVYLTRPDAILIPAVVLAFQAVREPRRHAPVALATLAGLVALLGLFRAYYGTALPLPFYLKTHGLNAQSAHHVAIFAPEKTKNVVQFLFMAAPFLFMAWHRLSRQVVSLLCAALLFVTYHYFMTIETMGHHSRFYVPATAPILVAAVLSYPEFRARVRVVPAALFCAAHVLAFIYLKAEDNALRIPIMLGARHDVPFLIGSCLVLLPRSPLPATTAVLCLTLLTGVVWANPIQHWALQTDTQILLRQIKPRRVFRGLARLKKRIEVRSLFHTDMGAPGMLFPEARVVDLDGLLNEDITLRGARFEALCEAERPEAIFVPHDAYPELRLEVLGSRCIEDYRPVDAREDSPLRVRADLLERYLSKNRRRPK